MSVERIVIDYQGKKLERIFSGTDIEIAKQKSKAYQTDLAYRSYVDRILNEQARTPVSGFSYTNPGNFRYITRPMPRGSVPKAGYW